MTCTRRYIKVTIMEDFAVGERTNGRRVCPHQAGELQVGSGFGGPQRRRRHRRSRPRCSWVPSRSRPSPRRRFASTTSMTTTRTRRGLTQSRYPFLPGRETTYYGSGGLTVGYKIAPVTLSLGVSRPKTGPTRKMMGSTTLTRRRPLEVRRRAGLQGGHAGRAKLPRPRSPR